MSENTPLTPSAEKRTHYKPLFDCLAHVENPGKSAPGYVEQFGAGRPNRLWICVPPQCPTCRGPDGQGAGGLQPIVTPLFPGILRQIIEIQFGHGHADSVGVGNRAQKSETPDSKAGSGFMTRNSGGDLHY